MRLTISDGDEQDVARVAAALSGGGFVVAGEGSAFDLRLTLIPPADRPAAAVDRRWLRHGGRRVKLTPIECAIVDCLANADGPVKRATLLEAVWGYRFDPGTNLVAVHISRLRAKLGKDAIPGGRDGYRLEAGKLVGATGFEPATPRPPV